jgi:hypothetical protein
MKWTLLTTKSLIKSLYHLTRNDRLPNPSAVYICVDCVCGDTQLYAFLSVHEFSLTKWESVPLGIRPQRRGPVGLVVLAGWSAS